MSRTLKIFAGLTVLVAGLSGVMFVTKSSSKPSLKQPGVGSVTPPLPTAPPPQQPNVALPTVAEPAVLGVDRSESSARQVAARLVALDEQRMVSEQAAATMTSAVASKGSTAVLVEQAVRQTRSLHRQLGEGLVLMSQPLRARTITITATSAEIDVWWVKVVSSPTQPNAGDIWGTTRVSLVWEDNTWKQTNEVSRLGPWPTHASDRVNHPTGASFLEQLNGFNSLTTRNSQ